MFTIKFGVTLLYSIPSMVLYLMTVIMLRRFPKDFSVTFAKLYIAFFVFNTITFFNSFVTVRIPQNTCQDCVMSFLFKAHTATNMSWFPLNVFYFITYNMAYIQFSMIFLTSLNRLSMIFWMNTYEKMWNRAFVFVILGVILIPIPFTLPVLRAETFYVYSDSLDCYTVGNTMDKQQLYSNLLAYLAGITVLTAVINITSFLKLSCMALQISAAERNLLFVSGSLFLVQLAADINTTIIRLFVNGSNKGTIWAQISVTCLPYVSDGLTIIHPWMFLAFSSKVRKNIERAYNIIAPFPGSSMFPNHVLEAQLCYSCPQLYTHLVVTIQSITNNFRKVLSPKVAEFVGAMPYESLCVIDLSELRRLPYQFSTNSETLSKSASLVRNNIAV